MVHDDTAVGLDGVRVEFDDERVVCDAGVMVVATLAGRLGIEALAQRLVRLRRDRPKRFLRAARDDLLCSPLRSCARSDPAASGRVRTSGRE